METDGAVAIFRRSIEKLGLMYKKYVGDGDSKSYTTVSNAQPYGPLEFIEKEECISHITKRMGTGLREIVRKNRGIFRTLFPTCFSKNYLVIKDTYKIFTLRILSNRYSGNEVVF